MTDEKTKVYLDFLERNQRLFHAVPGDRMSGKNRESIALCLTEIHFSSRRLIELTKRISETRPDSTGGELDSLLGDLCCLRAEVYDEMIRWAKTLKKPLKT